MSPDRQDEDDTFAPEPTAPAVQYANGPADAHGGAITAGGQQGLARSRYEQGQ